MKKFLKNFNFTFQKGRTCFLDPSKVGKSGLVGQSITIRNEKFSVQTSLGTQLGFGVQLLYEALSDLGSK